MRFLPCILASLFYGIKPTLVNLAIGAGESGNAIEFWGMLLTCLLAIIASLVRHDSLHVNLRQFFEMTLFGLCGFFLSSFFLLSAYKLLPVSTTLLFHFCYPALVSLFMACFFHQRMTPARGTAILLSLVGISIVADFHGGFSMRGCVYALLSGMFYGVYLISCEKASFSKLPACVKLFYLYLTSCIAYGALLLIRRESFSIGLAGAGCSTAIALTTGTMAVVLMMRSIQLIGAGATTILNNLEQVVGVAVSALAFHETLTPTIYLSCLLILGGSLLVGLTSNREANMPGVSAGRHRGLFHPRVSKKDAHA